MAAMNENTQLLPGMTKSASTSTGRRLFCSNTSKMFRISYCAIGAAILLFMYVDHHHQQGHYLKNSFPKSSNVADTYNSLTTVSDETKGVEISISAPEQVVVSVGSDDGEKVQLASPIAEFKTTGTWMQCI